MSSIPTSSSDSARDIGVRDTPHSAMRLLSAVGRSTAFASVAIAAAAMAAWQWGPGLLGIPPYILPPLSDVLREWWIMWGRDQLLFHTGITALETAAGFALGSLLGMVVGYVLGVSLKAEIVLSPYILALQIAPKVAFAPLFVMWFGFTIYPKILVAVLIVFFPVMVNVLSAVRTVDPDLISLARSFSARRWQIFRMIEFPSALPPLFSGLRISTTLAVVGVVVGEFVGGNEGLGYLLVYGEGSGDTAVVFVTIIMLTLIGILAYGAVVFAERRILHYLPRAHFGAA
jgi:NitT/TauT family transport system permease protein